MPSTRRKILPLMLLVVVQLAVTTGTSQSTSQDYPTPVYSNEISGSIKARDVGDARLTSYYYQFDGGQGDLFINIVTRNFTGDIDVFTLNGLRPLTKIVVYADFAETETGRVIYLRKPEKMLLRVQGRTPGDDAATFRIKFAGTFVASTMQEPPAEPALPNVTAKNESGIRVNSVGTIVEIIPKATPTPAPVEIASANPDEPSNVKQPTKAVDDPAADVERKAEDKPADPAVEEPTKKVEVVVTDDLPAKTETRPITRTRGRTRRPPPPKASTPAAATEEQASQPSDAVSPPAVTGRTRRGRSAAPTKTSPPTEPDPLEKVNLVILFKDGTRIERPMSEVLRFTVDKGVLTVIAKDGSIGRYSILDVTRVTIE